MAADDGPGLPAGEASAADGPGLILGELSADDGPGLTVGEIPGDDRPGLAVGEALAVGLGVGEAAGGRSFISSRRRPLWVFPLCA